MLSGGAIHLRPGCCQSIGELDTSSGCEPDEARDPFVASPKKLRTIATFVHSGRSEVGPAPVNVDKCVALPRACDSPTKGVGVTLAGIVFQKFRAAKPRSALRACTG